MKVAEEFAVEWLQGHVGHEVGPTDDLFSSVGIDSLDYAELLDALSGYLGTDFDATSVDDWSGLRTVRGIVRELFPCGEA